MNSPTTRKAVVGKRLKDILRALLVGVRRDRNTGHLYYPVHGVRLYIRSIADSVREPHRRLVFEKTYFRFYQPSGRDCVVDIGAGVGMEIVMLARHAPDLRYVAVEIQPWVYECLCLTLAQLPPGFTPFGIAIAECGPLELAPTRSGVDASVLAGGPVRIETVSWTEFTARQCIDQVDLLKVNVEGAETELLEHIDLGMVRRVIVNVHDFRADRGEGEHFRTRARVVARLSEARFRLTPVGEDWIFAER